MNKEVFENVTLTGHIVDKRDSRNHWITYLMILFKSITERELGGIVCLQTFWALQSLGSCGELLLTYITSLGKMMAEHELGGFVKLQTFYRITKDTKLWRAVINLMGIDKWMAERKLREILRLQMWLRAIKYGKLWRAITVHVMKGNGP